jgi:hypothetical protein
MAPKSIVLSPTLTVSGAAMATPRETAFFKAAGQAKPAVQNHGPPDRDFEAVSNSQTI